MLLKAKFEGDKIHATHVQRIDETASYCQELAKDQSNGFTKDRNMRRIGSPPMMTLLAYAKEVDPDFMRKAMSPCTVAEKNKAWRDFFASDYGRPFLMVEKLKH